VTLRYAVGIDLGTSNSALAYADLSEPDPQLHVFDVPQLVDASLMQDRELLPSHLYLPSPHEGLGETVVGTFARERGAQVPGRHVASAKSWLCHPAVDRTAAILPWGAPPDVPRLSPVAASARILRHLREAWDRAHADAPLAEQDVIVTVPASFDEGARALTLRAAEEAGLPEILLLEEPQSAFYDWTRVHRGNLGPELGDVRLVLVVDVGGGTTDLTLIRTEVRDEAPPLLERIAVGDHLLLGGDNMDIALARTAEKRIGQRLNASQFGALVQASRAAKELLLAEGAPERTSVAVAGAGSRLIGGTLAAELGREEVRALLLDGFFPRVAPTDAPARAAKAREIRSTAMGSGTSIASQLGLKVRRVVVDAGHGGRDTGAVGPHGVREKDLALAIAKKVAARLTALGFQVVMTRKGDAFLSLDERTRIANEAHADLFVSVHCNAARRRKLAGVETWTLNVASDRYAARLAAFENAEADRTVSDLRLILADLATKANATDARDLAQAVQSSLVRTLRSRVGPVRDHGVKQALFYVLLGTRMPSILVETGFISNPAEEARLRSARFQDGTAEAIARGVKDFVDSRRRLARAP